MIISVNIFYYFFSYFAVALVLALMLVPLMRPVAFKLGAVDEGTGRRIHTGIIPRLGGLGVFLAFMAPAVFSLTRGTWDPFHTRMAGILFASTMVLLIGAYDDIRGAGVRNKLLAEILAASLIYFLGIRIDVISNPFGGTINLGWMSLPATVLWIIVITNAVNLIDGLDGLAAGTGILISVTLAALSGTDMHLQLIYLILAGSLFGFLRYNFPPASIFMGDSGSLFLGFFLGSTSILSSHKATAIATMMIPVIAFIFPIMDMFYAVLRRYSRGISLGQADKEHIHHKLIEMGLSKRKVLFLLYVVNLCVLLFVLLIVRNQLNIDFFGLALIIVSAIVGLRMLGYVKFLPIMREVRRNFEMGRKRKYFNFVIRRFRDGAEKSRTGEDLRKYLDILMKEYNFNTVKIYIYPINMKEPFYAYGVTGNPETDKPLVLGFPIMEGDRCLGNVYMTKEVRDDYVLCAAELVRAITEELRAFAGRQS
ncbi:MAG: undecaprenyl/decaprenyl-phosphate alpha-N-acetylglucosaminyl 1-phosphate transferase [Nitrospirae bacterium]|nr:undecaprenyl/decaprenyl-phosphate alpha-N-acetylglucosaminyl 1-phosphate transferase [Nitrospirota bacterium]